MCFFWLHKSPVTNNGLSVNYLSVNYEQAKGKQWWASKQLPFWELSTWSMIFIDYLACYMLLVTINVFLHSVFSLFITNDKWWCQCQLEASKRKTILGIIASILLWIYHMEYDQYRPVLPFHILLVTIHVFLHSFLFVTSAMTNDGPSVIWFVNETLKSPVYAWLISQTIWLPPPTIYSNAEQDERI
jgi:hypothetical protein